MLVLQAAHNLNNTVRFLPRLFSRNLESTASNSSWVSYDRQDHQPFNWTGTSVLSDSGYQRAENYPQNKQRPVVQLSLCNWTISTLFPGILSLWFPCLGLPCFSILNPINAGSLLPPGKQNWDSFSCFLTWLPCE